MDANGQRFFLLADAADYGALEGVAHDAAKRRLRLASARRGPAPRGISEAEAEALLVKVPGALDAFGAWARWDATEGRVLAAGALDEPEDREAHGARPRPAVALFPGSGDAALGQAPTDVCLGAGGVVAVALGGTATLVDVRGRFAPVAVPHEGFSAWRVAASEAEGAGFVALDREARRLARLTGAPVADLPPEAHLPGVFRPCHENPDPPVWRDLPPPAWEAGESPVAVALGPQGDLAVLSWDGAPGSRGEARLWVRPSGAAWQGPYRLTSGFGIGNGGVSGGGGESGGGTAAADPEAAPATWAFSMAFVGAERLAVLVPGLFADPASEAPAPRVSEALVFAWPPAPRARKDAMAELIPTGELYPLTDPSLGVLSQDRAEPLLRGPGGEVGYLASAGPRALAPLSKRAMPARGRARGRVLDARAPRTVWHRVYMEAVLPEGTGIRLWLAATDGAAVPADDAFFPHDFGHVPAAVAGVRAEDVPRGAFVPARSEIPFEKGFLGCDPEPPRAGLFTALVQRAGRAVRQLAGRRLHSRIELFGTGVATPEIAALRVYGPRFSYVDEYLPELYAEDVFGPDGDEQGSATGADFLGRLLAIVESELTPMEDRVAAAHLLSSPQKTPDEALDWLASWVGLALDPAFPVARRRALLRIAPALARRHGTLGGLEMALDAVTSGWASAGKIVIVEDYRMRRVFATILGAHLEEQDDPLLPGGLIVSGNSYVGDTLFLGEGTHDEIVELAALYRATEEDEAAEEELGEDRADPLDGFYERFAHRVTALVHEDATAQEMDWIRRAVDLEAPAHVEVRVVKAKWPFLTGVASLVGVDSYLRPPVGLAGFRLDESELGVKDVLMRPPSLDPRLEGSSTEEMP